MTYINKYKLEFTVVIITMIIAQFMTNIGLISILNYICLQVEQKNILEIKMLVISPIIFLVLLAISCSAFILTKNRFIVKLVRDIRSDLYHTFMIQSPQKFLSTDKSIYVSIFNNDLSVIEDYYNYIIQFIGAIFATILVFFYSFNKNAIFSFVILIISVLGAIVPTRLQNKLGLLNEKYMNKVGNFNSFLNCHFSGYEEIRLYKKGEVFEAKFKEENDKLSNDRKEVLNLVKLIGNLIQIIVIGMQLLSLVVCGLLVLNGELNLSFLIVSMSITGNLSGTIVDLMEACTQINASKRVYNKVTGIIITKETPIENKISITEFNNKIDIISNIRFNNLNFSFKNKTIINNLNTEWKENEKIIITGSSGQGKSSLIKLLLGYFKIERDKIIINNKYDFCDLNLYDYCAVVYQDTTIFNGSIADNITLYGDYSTEEIENAIFLAGLKSFIDGLPNGINTFLHQSANTISGGEKQRIAIARALITGRNIIILDEPTANLDKETALKIEDTIFSLKDKMIIMITHNIHELSSQYSKVYKLNDGNLEMINNY